MGFCILLGVLYGLFLGTLGFTVYDWQFWVLDAWAIIFMVNGRYNPYLNE